MAESEACALWMQQRSAELGDEGYKYVEIGRIVSGEVFKFFETEVKPRTIAQKKRRR